MIFISRHAATSSQIELAAKAGFDLTHVGDVDAFAVDLADQIHALAKEHGAAGVACVHPLVALEAISLMSPSQPSPWFRESLTVGVFANENRGGEFVAAGLSTFAMNYAVEEAGWSTPTRKNFKVD
jgi:hypothetical protein